MHAFMRDGKAFIPAILIAITKALEAAVPVAERRS